MTVQELKKLAMAYRNVFGSELGKMVLEDLRSNGFEMNTVFDADALKMSRNEGRRQAWLHVKNLMEMDLNELEKRNKQGEEENE